MIRQEHKGHNLDRLLLLGLGPRQRPDRDLPETIPWREQETPLNRGAGDLDEGTFGWDKAKWVCHTHGRRKTPEKSLNFMYFASSYGSMASGQVSQPAPTPRVQIMPRP
jgi:hypothetical protein